MEQDEIWERLPVGTRLLCDFGWCNSNDYAKYRNIRPDGSYLNFCSDCAASRMFGHDVIIKVPNLPVEEGPSVTERVKEILKRYKYNSVSLNTEEKCDECVRLIVQAIKDAGYVKRKSKEEIKLALSLVPLSKDPAQDFYDWQG